MERWSFSWYTPNEVGLLIAEILFIFIGIAMEVIMWRDKSRWLPVALGVLGGPISYGLCRTFSRGAILAAFAGLFAIAYCLVRIYRKRTNRNCTGRIITFISCTLFLFLLAVAFTSAYERLSPLGSARDASVTNRLAVWKSAPAMLDGALWLGWGAGHSPGIYSNWFQDVRVPFSYVSLVSTYLDLGLDCGLLGLWVIFFGGAWMVCFPLEILRCRSPERESRFGIRGVYVVGLGICCLTANIFTSYVQRPWLFLIPGALYTLLALVVIKGRGWRSILRSAKVACIIGTTLGCGVLCSVLLDARSNAIECSRVGGSRVILCHRGHGVETKHCRIFYDQYALGTTPGKMLRIWFAETPLDFCVETEMYPFVADDPLDCTGETSRVLAIGTACSAAAIETWPCRLALLFPSTAPLYPAKRNRNVFVYLPETDELGLNESWVTWATQSGAKVEIVRGAGLMAQENLNPLKW
jgi:hypothetical protein